MPAVTLQNSTIQSNQNGSVFTAFFAVKTSVVTSFSSLTSDGSNPSGCQSAAGTRTSQAPKSMTTR